MCAATYFSSNRFGIIYFFMYVCGFKYNHINMKRNIFFGMVVAGLISSCASTKNDTTTVISPYSSSQSVGPSALVYGLPQTRLYFEIELVKTLFRKGPYAEYANRTLGLQNVPLSDSESWQMKSIRINNRQEVDNKQLYAVSFTDYPQNMDKLLRFSKEGLLLDLTISNVVMNSQSHAKSGDDFQFVNMTVSNTTVERVDTLYRPVETDTAFIQIPVLQRRVTTKTTEELAREAAEQIFEIRKIRIDVLRGDVDHPTDGAAFKLILQSLDAQEKQLLTLFTGAKIESRQILSYSVLPEKPATNTELFYFSEKTGIVNKNTAGAKPVWYEVGNATAPASNTYTRQANNIIYYRIPQVVQISAGVDKNTMASEQVVVYQFGNIVSFPLVAPKK